MEDSEKTSISNPLHSVEDGIDSLNAAWSFGGNTPKSFDSHVSRSVPKYNDGHSIVLALSDFFINKQSIVPDQRRAAASGMVGDLSNHSARKKQ
jgi:hypothetical protein